MSKTNKYVLNCTLLLMHELTEETMQHKPNYLYTRKIINYFSNQTTAIITTQSPVLFNFKLWKIKMSFQTKFRLFYGQKEMHKGSDRCAAAVQQLSVCSRSSFSAWCICWAARSPWGSGSQSLWAARPSGALHRTPERDKDFLQCLSVWDRCAGQMCTLHFCACCWTPSGFSAAPVHPSS